MIEIIQHGSQRGLKQKQMMFAFVTLLLDQETMIFDTTYLQAIFVKLSVLCHHPKYATLTIVVQNQTFEHLFVTIKTKEYTNAGINFFVDPASFLHVSTIIHSAANSSVSCSVFYIAQKNNLLLLDTKQIHDSARSESSVLVQGIADGGAKVIHTGKIVITTVAKQTVAKQTSKHITLSPSAFVYAKPILDVSQNAVQCFHGSAIGMIQSRMLFYLQSRGYSKKDATYWLLESMISNKKNTKNILHATLKKTIYASEE